MPSNDDYCAVVVREADLDRYIATLFAPAQHRAALYALYAFAVEIARVRDLAHQPMPGEIRLQWWREFLSGERSGEGAAHPVASALRAAIDRHGLAVDRLKALIDARGFDLYDAPMPNLGAFDDYAEATQSTLFSLGADILAPEAAATEKLSRHAGIAYATVGILSSLARHASRGQLYLPLDLMARHDVTRDAIHARQGGAPLRAVLAEMRAHARRHMALAQTELEQVPSAVLPAMLPAALVEPTLHRMERRGYEPFLYEPLSRLRRQWLLWRRARNPRRLLG